MHKMLIMLIQLKRQYKELYFVVSKSYRVILVGPVLQTCTFNNYVIYTSLENMYSLSKTQACVRNVLKMETINFDLRPTAGVLGLNRST